MTYAEASKVLETIGCKAFIRTGYNSFESRSCRLRMRVEIFRPKSFFSPQSRVDVAIYHTFRDMPQENWPRQDSLAATTEITTIAKGPTYQKVRNFMAKLEAIQAPQDDDAVVKRILSDSKPPRGKYFMPLQEFRRRYAPDWT